MMLNISNFCFHLAMAIPNIKLQLSCQENNDGAKTSSLKTKQMKHKHKNKLMNKIVN